MVVHVCVVECHGRGIGLCLEVLVCLGCSTAGDSIGMGELPWLGMVSSFQAVGSLGLAMGGLLYCPALSLASLLRFGLDNSGSLFE